MSDTLTRKENGERVCIKISLNGYTYPKYIFTVLSECGFSYENSDQGILFIHIQDTDLTIYMTVDANENWHHLISYKHSKWTLTYEGDVEYYIFGNDVLKTIRNAFRHWGSY